MIVKIISQQDQIISVNPEINLYYQDTQKDKSIKFHKFPRICQ